MLTTSDASPVSRPLAAVGALIVAAGLLMLGGCASTAKADPATALRPAEINHVVFFKLKDPDDAEALIEACDERLASIPGVVSYYAGQHVDVGRASVETGYDVGFYVGFDSIEDYLGYVEHPEHTAMVAEWRPRFEWLRVYDIR